MTTINHQDLIAKLKGTETIDLLYSLVEAKGGRHIDIINSVPIELVAGAEEAINSLIRYCKTIQE